jgi:prepilin-type N-terminal cleavage/methylation domain-containing protein
MHRSKRTAGMTLTELMIAVGMIGLLASLAIPSFITYQARARRSEAYVNLGAISRSEKGYFAEQGIYFEAPTQPITVGADLGAESHEWTPAAAADFGPLGWEPEGKVRYSYDVNTGSTNCACNDTCFTATAYGDVDEDDNLAAFSIVQPVDVPGGGEVRCPPHLFFAGAPAGPANEIIQHPLSDQY